MATSPQFPSVPVLGGANLSDTTLTTLITGGTNGSYIEKLVYFSSNDEAVALKIFINDGVNDYQIEEETVGTGGTLLLDFAIPQGASLKVQLSGAPSATVSVVAFGGDY